MYNKSMEAVVDYQGICLVITRFQVRCPVRALVSLAKKLYSHCLSHPAVKPVKYCVSGLS